MAKYSNVVEYNIVTDVDTSGIIKLQNELTKLKQSLKFDKSGFSQLGFDDAKIEKSIQKVNQLQTAIAAAFNPKIGTIDLSKLNASLQKEHTSLQMIVKDWEQMGTRGTMAISNLSNALLSMNKGALNVNTTLSKIANTFGNTVRWGITASIFQGMMSSVQGAVSYMKNLDESLTQIQMVTNSSKENMRELAQYANNAAQALGSTTVDYTNAVKVFVQEGFSESESKQYANLSTKLANVSEQNTATTSDQITAYRNAFQLDYEQTVAAMDKVANVANNTASNVNELMVASQRAASVAQAVGSSQDSFLAAIATIESVTRQSAEEIGNGLKAIYQRFADIKVGKSAEDGVDYGQYATALKSVGVDVLDVAGQFKGMDQILSELQDVWSELDDTMKIAVGEKVAGKFQYNRFAALMNNPEYYQKALGATQNADGMMDQMNEYYIESIEGRLNTLQAAGEQVMSTLFNQDAVEPMIEQVTELVNGLNSLVDVAGGLNGVVQVLGATMLRAFSTQIAGTISNMATAISTITANSRNANQLQTTAQLVGLSNYSQSQNTSSLTGKLVSGVANNYNSLSDKTQERIRDLSQQIVELEEQKTGVLKEQESFFKQIAERAIEEKNIKDQQIEIEREILAQKRDNKKITQEQYADEILKLDVLEDENRIYEKIRKEASEFARVIAQGGSADEEMIARLQQMRQEASGLGINIAELESLIEQLGIAEGNLKIGETMVDDTLKMADFEARINGVVKTLSNVTSVAFGFSMIGDAIKTLADDSATLEEKLNAVVMNGLMGLTMLLPGLTALVAQTKAWVLATVAQTNAIAGETAAERAQNAAQILNNLTRGTAIKIILTSIAERIKHTAAIIAETVALKAQAIAALAAQNPIAALTIGLGVLAIGIAAATKAWIDNYGEVAQATKEYEKQSEILTETKRNYQDVTEKVETLNNSLDKISDMRSSLDDMKEGTDEWKEAVRKLNSEILTLIQTYPEIAKFVSNENGVLSLDSEKNVDGETLNDFYNKQIAEANHLNDINSIQQINTLDAKNNQLIAEYAQKNNVSSGDVRNALNNNEVEIAGREDLTSSFAELAASIQSNNATIETLNGTIGTLNTNYENLAGNAEIDTTKALQELQQRWGNMIYDQYGDELGYKTDLSTLNNDSDLLKEIGVAIGKDISSGVDTSIFDDTLKVITKDGEEIEHSTEVWMQILANSEEATRAANELFETNKYIYETFGAKWDDKTQSFIGEINEDAKTALNAYNSGDAYNSDELFKTVLSENVPEIGSIKEFATAIEAGTINIEGLSEAVKKLTPDIADLTKNINGNDFTNRLDFGLDPDDNNKEYKKFLKDQNITESALDRMSRDTYEDNAYYQQQKESLESLIETKQKDKNITDEETKEIENLQSKLDGLEDSAKDTTIMILRMSNGVVSLRNKISDISEILSNDALKGTVEWYEALDDLDSGLSEVLNIDAGTLSDTFIESGDALEYAQRMAEGDMSAIDDLRRAASKDIIQNLSIQLKKGEDIKTVRSDLLSELNQLQAEIDAGTITVTTDLDDNPFIQKLNKMLADSQISAEQASNILSSIGMEANVKYAEGKGTVDAVEYEVDIDYVDQVGPMPGGGQMPSIPKIRMIPHMVPVKTTTKIPYLQGTHYTGSGVQTASTAARNPSYTGGYSKNPKSSGGGNKSPKGNSKQGKHNQKKEKEKNEWDYLTDITNDLERQSAVMEKLANLEDRLYGADRIANLQQERAEHAKNIGLLEKEVKLAEKHKKTLQTQGYDENGNLTINAYARRAGFDKIQFDSAGNLENGKAIEAALTKRENDAIAQYNLHRNDEDTSYYEEQVRLAKEDHDGFMKAVSDYENTLNTIDDTNLEIQKEREALQDAADKIIDSIQNGIDTICDALETQRDFDRMKNQFFRGGEGYSHFKGDTRYYSRTLNDTLGKTFNYKLENVDSRIKDAEKVLNSKDPDKEKISQAQAVQNLKETTDDLISTIKKAVDAYNGLLKTISEASSKMDELIDDRIAAYDRIEKTLDTRLTQLKLMFGENGYKDQAAFYNQKIATAISKINNLMISKKAEEEKIETLKTIEADNKELSSEQRKELKDATNKVNEIQEEILDTETQALQDNRALLEALTRQNVNETINGIFGGQDLEWLSQEWEMRTRNDEQYLDDYNRAAELEKLQLKYQNLLNNSQNASSAIQKKISDQMKQQLTYLQNKKKYVLDIVGAEKETQSVLKEVNAITKYDVEYAEKQLDILQKQIALEEAKNNKNQMRLQRNAAGNYDFVYGADENQVVQATQELINAQQEAYNLAKNAMLQTYEMAMETALKTKETLVEIVMDTGLGAEEQKNRIQEVLGQLGVFINNSRLEYGETIIDTYNEFVEAETTISEQNLGNLTEIFNELRGKTTEYNSSASKDIGDFTISAQQSLDNLDAKSAEVWMHIVNQSLDGDGAALPRLIKGWEDTFGESGTMLALFNTMANGVNSSFDDMESHVTGTMLPKMEQGTNPFLGDNGTITTLFLDAWDSTETRFSLMKDNTIAGMTTLTDDFSTLTDDMMSCILNFGRTNEEVLITAGDHYYNFTQNSVKEAKEETGYLTRSENDFKTTLSTLNGVIATSAKKLNDYAEEIKIAFNRSEVLINESTKLQRSLGEVEYSAAKAADELERLANNSTVDVNVSYNTTYTTTYRTNYETNGYPTSSTETTTTTDSSSSSSGGSSSGNNNTGSKKPIGYRWKVSDQNGAKKSKYAGTYEAALGLMKYFDNPTYPVQEPRYDTGGYTGTWFDGGVDNKKGKLAILHQKELVLNADDTKNMLSTVEVVRNIMSNINQLPSLGKNISSSTLNNDVEQRVEINANFPGVTTALEIERALTELADNAYQYANKYKN